MELTLGRFIVVVLAAIGLLFLVAVFFSFFVPCSENYFPDLIERFICKHFGKKTNGDWIRSMTNEELANFLATDAVIACVHCKDDLHTCSGDDPCEKCDQASVFWNWLGEELEGSRWTYE